MQSVTEEQKEMEEQAIALKWQSDSRRIRQILKFAIPNRLAELREAQYFGAECVPLGQGLSDVILASFIQEELWSEWKIGALRNVKKILPPSQKNMLERWPKKRQKILEGDYISRDTQLSALDVARVYAILNDGQNGNVCDVEEAVPPSFLTNRTLISLAQVLPFFDEESMWSEKAQKRFGNVLVQHLCRNLAYQQPQDRCDFVLRTLARTTIPEKNEKRTSFMIKMLGTVSDRFGDRPDGHLLGMVIKNLAHQKRFAAVKQIRTAFHLDDPKPNPKPHLALLRFLRREDR